MKGRAVKFTIEQVEFHRRIVLHMEYQEIPNGMTREKLIRHMLNNAAEKFPERVEAARHD